MEGLMVIGVFGGQEAGQGLIAVGGYAGLLSALLAWYMAAAALIRAMGVQRIAPVGGLVTGRVRP
jgi:succinate-acetate transporter protein